MSKVDADLYASRIETLKRGGALLRQQIEGLAKLITEYGKVLEIIDIEYESGNVAADFASQPDSVVFQRMEELKQVEEKTAAIRNQLEANEEVKRL